MNKSPIELTKELKFCKNIFFSTGDIPEYIKKAKSYLSLIDLFGQKIDLTYRKEVFFKTYYGAIYTIILFILILLQIIAGYRDMTSRYNPIINYMELETQNIEKINIFSQDINIAFAINSQDRNEHILNDTLFNFETKLISRHKNDTFDKLTSFFINMKNCEMNDFRHYENIFNNFSLNKAFCLDKKINSNINFEIFSFPEEFTENYFKLKLRVCDNKALIKTNCTLNENFVKDVLPNLQLNLYIIHKYFDGIDMKNPIKPRLTYINFNLEEEILMRKKTYFYFTKNFLTDYKDIYSTFAEPEPITFVGFNPKDMQSLMKYDKGEGVNFVEIYFKIDNIPKKFIRKYTTFFDLLANIGGLLNALYIFGMIVFGFINRILLDVEIINDHFNIIKKNKNNDEKGIFDNIQKRRNNFEYLNNEFEVDFGLNFEIKNIRHGYEKITQKDKFMHKLKKKDNDDQKNYLKDLQITNDENINRAKELIQNINEVVIRDDSLKLIRKNENFRNFKNFQEEKPEDSDILIREQKKENPKNFDNLSNLEIENFQKEKGSKNETQHDKDASGLSDIYTKRCVSFSSKKNEDLLNIDYPFRKLYPHEIDNYKKRQGSNQFQHENLFRFRFGIKEVISSLLCINNKEFNKRNEIYHNCKQIIDNYMDMNNLIPIIQEFKIMKSLLFNKTQLFLINNYKKPTIKINDYDSVLIFRKSDLYENLKSHCEIIENNTILKLHENLNHKSSKIDRKLVELSKIIN